MRAAKSLREDKMRALLLASGAILVLAACDQTDTAEAPAEETEVAEAEAPAPAPGPGPGGPGGPGGVAAQIEELRASNPRIGPDRTAEFIPDPNVAEQRPPNTWTLGGLEPSFPEQTRAPIPDVTHAWR